MGYFFNMITCSVCLLEVREASSIGYLPPFPSGEVERAIDDGGDRVLRLSYLYKNILSQWPGMASVQP